MPSRLLSTVIVLILLTGFFYWWVLRPQHKEIRKEARQVQTFEQSTANLRATLNSMPPIGEEERHLWRTIEARLHRTLNSEEEITATLKTLADLAHKSGATLATVTVKAPETPKAAPRPAYRRSPRRSSGATIESMDEAAARVQARTDPNAPRAATPGTGGQTASQPRLTPVPPRYAREPAPEAPGFKYGQRVVQYHPAYLKIKGAYATWPEFLARISRNFVPVLIDKIEGRGGGTTGHLDVLMSVPVVDKSSKPGATDVEGDGSPAMPLSNEIVQMYHLDALREQLPGFVIPERTDPFPDVVAEIVMEEEAFVFPELVITAILERNDEFVAVVNERVVGVGDVIEGVEIKSITPTTVIFAEKLR